MIFKIFEVTLKFTIPEIEAWGVGVIGHEFDLPPELQNELLEKMDPIPSGPALSAYSC